MKRKRENDQEERERTFHKVESDKVYFGSD